MFGSSLGRFTSPDNFLNDTNAVDPASWNLYVYVRNNPLTLIDPSGEQIYVGDIKDPKDREEFLRRANATYGCNACVTIDSNGFLAVNTEGLSEAIIKATQYLTDAINSMDPGKLFSVQVTNNNNEVAFGDSRAGSASVQLPGNNFKTSAIRVRLDFADDKWVSGDKDAVSSMLDLVFAHEIAHWYPTALEDPKDGRKTGPVVNRVNEIRQALNLPLRGEYSGHTSIGGDSWAEVRFGQAKLDKRGKPVRKNNGIRVEEKTKIVRWVKSNVGGQGVN